MYNNSYFCSTLSDMRSSFMFNSNFPAYILLLITWIIAGTDLNCDGEIRCITLQLLL